MKISLLLLFSMVICYPVFGQKEDNPRRNDTLFIQYNARNQKLHEKPTYYVNQNGFIIFEIQDVNLFRYKMTLTELQDNVINSTRLSEGNTEIQIDPSIFNLTNINLDIPVVTYENTADVKALITIEKDKLDKEREIKQKLKEIESNKNLYLDAKLRIEDYQDLLVDKADAEAELSRLVEINKVNNKLNEKQKEHQEYYQEQLRESTVDLSFIDPSAIKKDKTWIENYINKLNVELESQLSNLQNEYEDIRYKYNKEVEKDLGDNTKLSQFDNAMKDYLWALFELNKLTELYNRLITNLYSDKSRDDIERTRDKITGDFFPFIVDFNRDDILKQSYERLNQVEFKFYELSQVYSKHSDIDKISDVYNKIAAFNSQIKPESYQKFFLELSKVYDATNPSNFTLKFRTLIVSDNADVINFRLTGVPQRNLPGSVEVTPLDLEYNVKIRGGVKIDVSTGVFWNIGLNDNSYRFEKVTDSTTRVVKEENKNLFVPSFGLMFNVYKRSDRDIKLGGSIGFSTNTERLNYYLGGSLLIGKSERININFGIAGAQIKTVSDEFDTEELINQPLADLPKVVPLRNPSPFRIGAYFGVTFNLLGTKNKATLSQVTKI